MFKSEVLPITHLQGYVSMTTATPLSCLLLVFISCLFLVSFAGFVSWYLVILLRSRDKRSGFKAERLRCLGVRRVKVLRFVQWRASVLACRYQCSVIQPSGLFPPALGVCSDMLIKVLRCTLLTLMRQAAVMRGEEEEFIF